MFTEQIHEGEGYDVLEKCIHIGILDFEIFEDTDAFYSLFHLWEDSRHIKYSDKLELHVLELPKLAKHQYPETELLSWMQFINAELFLVFLQLQLGAVQRLAPLGGEVVLNFLEVGVLAQEYPQLVLDGLRLLLHLPHRPAVHVPAQVDHAVLLEQIVVELVLRDQLWVVGRLVVDLNGHLSPAVFN